MDTIDGGDGMFVPEWFDTDVQDALNGVNEISAMIDDVVESVPEDDGGTSTSWAPPLPGLPDPTLPGAVPWIDIIHPEEFALNGFPYQGQDPTQPGYYSLPTF